MSSSKDTLLEIAAQFKAGDVLDNMKKPAGGVIVIESKMTPLEAARLLWENNIMGAPVYNVEANKFVGMFDTRDILSCIVAAHREFISMGGKHSSGEDTVLPHEVNVQEQHRLVEKALQAMKIDSKPGTAGAITVTYLAARNPLGPEITKDTPLVDVLKALADRNRHRVVLPGAGNVCNGIISQSGLITFIASKLPKGSLLESIEDAGLPYRKDVVQINEDEKASEAFTVIDKKRLSGIAVVDSDGKLIGNTSARDVKFAAMDRNCQVSLDLDIISYLAAVRQAVAENERSPVCKVRPEDTMEHVIKLLAKTGYHRVFVVDGNAKPVGVISFADIINYILS